MDNYIIYAIFLVISIIILTIKLLPLREWAEKWVGNDVKRARIYVRDGSNEKVFNGKRKQVNDIGSEYVYRDGKLKSVMLPPDYPVIFIHGWRKICVVDGQVLASNIEGTRKISEPVGLISALTQTNFLEKYVNRVGKSDTPAWLWIVIAVAVIAVGWFVYNQFLGGGVVTPLPTPAPSPTPTGFDPIIR